MSLEYVGYVAVALAIIITLYNVFKLKKKEDDANMGIQSANINGGEPEDDNDDDDDEEEDDEEDFDFGNELKGMTEKQLLKVLVLSTLENNYEHFTDNWQKFFDIAKEE